MGILDDAIREHLDLKRKHGARDSELRELEDEALGSTDRPDTFASPELYGGASSAEAPAPEAPPLDEPTRLVEPEPGSAAEPEPAGEVDADMGSADEPLSPPEGLQQVPGQEQFEEPIPGQQRLDEPGESEAPPDDSWRSLPEVEPPAPSESLEELISEEEPFPADTEAPAPAPEPPEATAPPEPPPPPAVEEPAVEEPEAEPESSVPDPPPPPPDRGPEPPGRARGRVDVPTQEHPPPGETGGLPPLPDYEDEHDLAAPADEAPPVVEPPSEERPQPLEEPEAGPQLYDFESDEEPSGGAPAARDAEDDFEALGPETDERPYVPPETDEAPYIAPETDETPFIPEEDRSEEPPSSEASLEDEDVYEGESLEPEESYEERKSDADDDLWFEKGPPKDFDFDD